MAGELFHQTFPTLFNQGSAGTQVDLNLIPTALIERIDTLSVGGAPIYGSDAISGTVNIILRTEFEGLEVSGISRITDEGDGFSYNASAICGKNFSDGRGNVTLAYTRDEQDGLVFNQRDFLRDNIGNAGNLSLAQAIARRGAGANTSDGRVNPKYRIQRK